jgi:protein phosphatase
MRDGELTQITKDDTFVQTLVDEGRITAEEAHSHPQRSLIMRALTGHEVEPTLTVREAHAGDRYLLCSDGLSDPVSHETILDALQIPDVTESADRLIEMALRGGGPDNVTVVVADVVDYEYGQTQPILAGAVSGEDDQSAPPNTAAGRASAFNPKRVAAAKRPTVEPEVPKKRSRRRMIFGALLLLVVVLAGLAVGRIVIQNNYYVAERDGSVHIMRGVQGSFLGMPLQQPFQVACLDARNSITNIGVDDSRAGCKPLKVADLRESERAQVTAGLPGGTLDEAIRQLRELAQTSVLPICLPPPTRTTTTSTPAPPPASSAPPEPSTTSAAPPPAPSTTEGAPEVPTTVTAPPPPPSPSPTVTALPPPPQKPGTDCRTAP